MRGQWRNSLDHYLAKTSKDAIIAVVKRGVWIMDTKKEQKANDKPKDVRPKSTGKTRDELEKLLSDGQFTIRKMEVPPSMKKKALLPRG